MTRSSPLGWPSDSSTAGGTSTGPSGRESSLGWPGVNVSRETEAVATSTDDVEPADAGVVSRETAASAGEVIVATVEDPALHDVTPVASSERLVDPDGVVDPAGPPTRGDWNTPLARAVTEEARRREALRVRAFPKPARTRIVTVANQKGGVGKTTTAVNIAAGLALAGLSVLVIDLDPQGNASTALGIDHHSDVPSIYEVIVDGRPLAEVVRSCPDVPGLSCAPSTIDLAGAEIELVSLVARESRLHRALTAYLDEYPVDYVFVDCPPSLGLLTVNALVAAREVFVPIQCEYYALEGVSMLLKNIDLVRTHLNPDLRLSTILLTMMDARTRLSAQVADEVRTHFPEAVLATTIPRSVRISEAPSFGQTVITYDPTGPGAMSYLEAAGEFADRGGPGTGSGSGANAD